jgi:hypothetical protein
MGAAWASAIAYSLGGLAVGVIFARTLGIRIRALVPRGSEVPEFVQGALGLVRRAS